MTDRTKVEEGIPTWEYPDFFARFYDTIYHQVRDSVDNRFYLNLIRNTDGNVLEAGAGTGRLFIQALENGSDIYGIDISPSMLAIARSKLKPEQQFRLSQGNITDFGNGIKFDLIIAPFRVFMHLTEKEDQLKAIDNVYKNLSPGGKFVFDVFVPDLKPLISGLKDVVDFDGEYEPGKRVKRIISTVPDIINQRINILFRLEWNEESSFYKREWKTCLRFFFRYELEHLIERSSFKNYKISGDFLGNDLDIYSKEFIVTCIK